MAEFCSANSGTIPPLPWQTFPPPFSAGLHLAVHILKHRLGWRDGDEIITTPITFVSTGHAIKYERLDPVFADVDDSLCLAPESVERMITDRTRAVIFVGVGGNTGQYESIVSLCRRRGLSLILDAAHMAGTYLNGRIPGAEADAVVYSFHAVKNLPTADSGMVCFREQRDDALARQLSWLGIDKDTYTRTTSGGTYKWRYEVDHVGFKYHGNSIMAAIALVQLRYLDSDNAYRRELAAVYDDFLAKLPEVGRIPMAAGCTPSRHLYQVLLDNRDEAILALNASDVFPGVHYQENASYRAYAGSRAECPKAVEYSARLLSLPLHLRMTHKDAETVCELLHKSTRENRGRGRI